MGEASSVKTLRAKLEELRQLVELRVEERVRASRILDAVEPPFDRGDDGQSPRIEPEARHAKVPESFWSRLGGWLYRWLTH